jgi:uncharacterized protein YktA (UPF0223 family)
LFYLRVLRRIVTVTADDYHHAGTHTSSGELLGSGRPRRSGNLHPLRAYHRYPYPAQVLWEAVKMSMWDDYDEVFDALEEQHMKSPQPTNGGYGQTVAHNRYSAGLQAGVVEVVPSKSLDRRSQRELEYKRHVETFNIELEFMLKRLRIMHATMLILEQGQMLIAFIEQVELAVERGVSKAVFMQYKRTFKILEEQTTGYIRGNR